MNAQRCLVLIGAVVAAAGTARLGVWQLSRAGEKNAAQEAIEARRALPALSETDLPLDAAGALVQMQRPVVVRGRWLPDATRYLDNRPLNGRAGFLVLTPLQLADGSAVVVQRGWLPRDAADRTRIGAYRTPAGEDRIRGRLAPPPSRIFEFEGAASGPIRQNLDLDALAREAGRALRPYTIVQEDDAAVGLDDGLQRDWPRPAADAHKNYGYAFQWFALSATIIGLYVWFQVIAPRRRRPA